MGIFDSIESGFRALLAEVPYDQVTVAQICDCSSVSKKTFYKHFASKHELLVALIRNDVITPVRKLREILPLDDIKSSPRLVTERIYQTLYENRAIYQNLFLSLGRATVAELIAEETYGFNREVFDFGLSPEERDYAAYFVAISDAMIAARWLAQDCPVSVKAMAKYCELWIMSHIREANLHAWS